VNLKNIIAKICFLLILIFVLVAFVWFSSCINRLKFKVGLVSCDFDNIDLRNIDLHGSNLSYATLRNANLQGSNLQDANLEYADLTGANLTNANLKGIHLSNTKLIDVIGLPDKQLAEILNVSLLNLPQTLSKRTIWLESEDKIYNTLSEVCKGKAVSEAANYDKYDRSQIFHPVVLFQNNGTKHQWTSNINALGWSPMTVHRAELVACVGQQKIERIEKCNYVIPSEIYKHNSSIQASYERYQYQMDIKLLAANTNSIVAETTLVGEEPRCLDELKGTVPQPSYSKEVDFKTIETWLHDYVVANYM
jgi:hypothetical protein